MFVSENPEHDTPIFVAANAWARRITLYLGGRPGRPSWMSKGTYDSMPKTIELREIQYVIAKPGRKQQPFVIVTTMTEVSGEDAVSPDELAELFDF